MLGIGLLVPAALIIGFPTLAAQSQQTPSQGAPDPKPEQRNARVTPSQDQFSPPEKPVTPRLRLRSPSSELEGELPVQRPNRMCDFVCPR
jgi:hypothetical protein